MHAETVSIEVVVVENASYDGCGEMLAIEFPQVRFIQSQHNIGFARASNLGHKHSTGRFLLFLNPDTKIMGSALSDLVSALDSLQDGGAIGCRLLNADGTLQTSCIQSFPTILNQCLDSEALRSRYPTSHLWGMAPLFSEVRSPTGVEMVSGAALMLRRDVFEAVAGFGEAYFMYGEDCDLCHKVKRAGWKIYYLPSACIVHYGGASTKKAAKSFFATVVMQDSLHLYFATMRGRTYAALFRITRVPTALVRLILLWSSSFRLQDQESRDSQAAAVGKWTAILGWAIGMKTPVSRKPGVSSTERPTPNDPLDDPVSKTP